MEEYNRLCLISTKDVRRIVCSENGNVYDIPFKGVETLIKGKTIKDSTNLPFLILEEYDNFYKDYATKLPIAKGKKDGVPVFVLEDAKTVTYSEDEADFSLLCRPNYKKEVERLYEDSMNALELGEAYEQSFRDKYSRQSKPKVYKKRL